jgi:hypothetical protein
MNAPAHPHSTWQEHEKALTDISVLASSLEQQQELSSVMAHHTQDNDKQRRLIAWKFHCDPMPK